MASDLLLLNSVQVWPRPAPCALGNAVERVTVVAGAQVRARGGHRVNPIATDESSIRSLIDV